MVPSAAIVFSLLVSLGGPCLKSEASPILQITEHDWPMLMHDPSHSGYTSESIAPEPLTGRLNVKWKVGLGERVEIETQPVVAYDKVYIGVMNGKFHAINADSGQIDWTFIAGGAIPHTGAVADGKVYFGCEDGRVYALDARTGDLIWSYQTDGPLFSSPTVVNNVLYMGSFDTYLYALDAGTGNLHWRHKTGGRVWTSPAVVNDRIYFGSEDMHAYCLNVTNGSLVWKKQINGVSMRNTYPVVSNGVAIFATVKPGVESYMPREDFDPIQGLTPEQVIDLWNDYYQQFPERQYLFYLDANTGQDKWDPINKKYVPFPLPYWGLIIPLVDADGFAWFPASGGGGDHALDHNDRLWRISLADGTIFQAGSQDEYMMQLDETGTHTMGGNKYYQTAQMNVGMFDTNTKQKYHIYGGPVWPYGEPLDPTPTIHQNRYAGSGWSMWDVGASSPLVIAGGVGYYTAYSWLYALTPDDVAEPAVVDLGIDHTLGPPRTEKTYSDFVDELDWRVEQIIGSGPLKPQPVFWGWNKATLHPIWLEGEAIVSLAQTMPYLRADLQEDLKAYLRTELRANILEIGYDYRMRCMLYDQVGIVDPCQQSDREDEISVYWHADDLNVIAENLYAAWAYAYYTEDWQTIADNWSLLSYLYARLAEAFDNELGFYVERNPDGSAKRWHTPDLKLNLQIATMQGVAHMAEHVGDTVTRDRAHSMLQRMYEARLELGEYVQTLYDQGIFQRAEAGELESFEILPWQGYRDRDTDSRQVFWTDGARWEIFSFSTSTGGGGSGIITQGTGNYSDLVGYRPMFPELGSFLGEHLRDETEQYVQTVMNLNPWWYWNDATHCMQISGENFYNLPHFSNAIFQAKAYIVGEDFDTLRDQLPWEYTAAGSNDIYRLQNLVALLQIEGAHSEPSKTVVPTSADFEQTVTYAISLIGTGAPLTITDTFPDGLSYVANTANVEPDIGQLQADSTAIHWSGSPTTDTQVTLSYAATVVTTDCRSIANVATLQGLGTTDLSLTAIMIANGLKVHLPLVSKSWD
jgi:outer membrane protein assembly factor BamB